MLMAWKYFLVYKRLIFERLCLRNLGILDGRQMKCNGFVQIIFWQDFVDFVGRIGSCFFRENLKWSRGERNRCRVLLVVWSLEYYLSSFYQMVRSCVVGKVYFFGVGEILVGLCRSFSLYCLICLGLEGVVRFLDGRGFVEISQ